MWGAPPLLFFGAVHPCPSPPLLFCLSPSSLVLFSERDFSAQPNTKAITFVTSFPFWWPCQAEGALGAGGSQGGLPHPMQMLSWAALIWNFLLFPVRLGLGRLLGGV